MSVYEHTGGIVIRINMMCETEICAFRASLLRNTMLLRSDAAIGSWDLNGYVVGRQASSLPVCDDRKVRSMTTI
ncbi:MAG: hypothetical protein WC083_07165 [Candidatus Methanomethylophilaceae archaeon]